MQEETLTTKEIAEKLNCTEVAIRKRMSRAGVKPALYEVGRGSIHAARWRISDVERICKDRRCKQLCQGENP